MKSMLNYIKNIDTNNISAEQIVGAMRSVRDIEDTLHEILRISEAIDDYKAGKDTYYDFLKQAVPTRTEYYRSMRADDITIKHLENMLVDKINLIKELLGDEK